MQNRITETLTWTTGTLPVMANPDIALKKTVDAAKAVEAAAEAAAKEAETLKQQAAPPTKQELALLARQKRNQDRKTKLAAR